MPLPRKVLILAALTVMVAAVFTVSAALIVRLAA